MATIEKLDQAGKRVPIQIIISGNRIDKGEFRIKTSDRLRLLDDDGEETNTYIYPERRETSIGGIEVIPEDKRQDFMDTIGQIIDAAYQKQE